MKLYDYRQRVGFSTNAGLFRQKRLGNAEFKPALNRTEPARSVRPVEVLPESRRAQRITLRAVGVFPRRGRGGARARERVRRTPRLAGTTSPRRRDTQPPGRRRPLLVVSGGSPVNFPPWPSLVPKSQAHHLTNSGGKGCGGGCLCCTAVWES